jgi:putative two-component system response regulator
MMEKGSILVVDDESGPRESLRMILKPIYDVHTASNGQDAINFIRRENVDLVTLDLKMPGLSGIDVLREIKKIRNDIEVVIITGFGTLANAVEAIRYGVIDFISKPFNIVEIISIAKRSIERRNFNLKIRDLIKRFMDPRFAVRDGKTPSAGNVPPWEAEWEFLELQPELQKEIRQSLHQLESFWAQRVTVNYLEFLKVLIYILESKEPYTNGHSERVTMYSAIIAQDLDLSGEEKEDLQIATLLHDIGKIGLSNRLLEKIELNQEESQSIRFHPIKGVRLIEPLDFSHNVISAIRHHHERWDGKGYPDGLMGSAIPLLARIITLADSYDAMTSDRPYRSGLSPHRVEEEIEKNAGTQFDPEIVELFLRHFKNGQGLPSLCPAAGVH